MSLRLTIIACTLTLLAGCSGGGGIASIIGMDQKSTPDEFAVVKRAPLTLPPDFSLKPPDPNGERQQNLQVRDQAKSAVFGNDAKEKAQQALQEAKKSGLSQSEMALLKTTGALEADKDIRSIIDSEVASLSTTDDGFVRSLLFWKDDPSAQERGDILDATKENKRIQQNSSLGKDVTDGETPIIRRTQDNPLFNWF